MMELTLRVAGMTCPNCAGHVQRAVEALAEGLQAKVHLEQGLVVVSAARLPEEATLARAITQAGFRFEGRMDA
ncbi:MAG: heavy metal-associated domain-containing protein [bacterium]|jgi:copper chaperone CopZ|nr:heavy metal-associated domain-containing protein [bacterium]